MNKLLLLLPLLIFKASFAQSPLTSNYFNYHLVDRSEILNNTLSSEIFTAAKPYSRKAVNNFNKEAYTLSKVDSFNKAYLLTDNVIFSKKEATFRNKPILKNFYDTESAMLYIAEPRFNLVVNPVLAFTGGTDKYDSLSLYTNSRGAELRGNIGNKVGFYSYALENQARFPSYLRDKHNATGVINGTTLHKNFGQQGEDYFNVAGYVTFSPIEEIMVQFGHDKNFFGNGYRSLILSDLTAPYPFLKFNTKVWKLNYTNLYSEHIDFVKQGESATNGRKFSALHHLSINVTKNLNIGLFENIIFDRKDSLESDRYELAYLNPIIFYRALEHGLNSSDNAMLGLDWKWNFKNHFSFYGQFILDELVTKEFFGRTNSWVNKQGYQAGLKYVNVANINNLDLQVEINQVRPYVYQHRTRSQNWIHYNQNLAHPLGANFREILAIVRYQPLDRLNITGVFSLSTQGIDSSLTSSNFGGNALRTYYQIPDRNDAYLVKGVEDKISTFSLQASYMAWHNLFLDLGFVMRHQENALLNEPLKNSIIHFGLRLNSAAFNYRQ